MANVKILACIASFAIGVPLAHAAADWQQEWETVQAAAKQERAVTLYGGYNPIYKEVMRHFEKKYPDIRLEYIPGGGSEHVTRIMAERRAGQYLADLVMGGASTFQSYPEGTFDPLNGFLILPEILDAKAWYGGEVPFVDPQGKYVFMAMGSPSQQIAYNTKQVNPEEIKAWRDLLDPKWKGKVARSNRSGRVSATFLFFHHTPALGDDFIRKLFTDAHIGQSDNLRQAVNWLADGRYSLFIDIAPDTVAEAKNRGLPVDVLGRSLDEGDVIAGGYCCLAVLNRARNPNATKVFVNWFLSKEGQLAFQTHTKDNSLRTDISKDMVAPALRLEPGRNYLMINNSRYTKKEDVDAIRKILDEGQALKH